MKATKSITIDAVLWAKVRQKTDNISATIEYLLRRWEENEAEVYERNKITTLKNELEERKAEIATMSLKMRDWEKEKDKSRIIRTIK